MATDVRRFTRNYGLGILLLILFMLTWVGQWVAQLMWSYSTWAEFWATSFMNWQSEFLQLLVFVWATKYLPFAGSHEAKDPDENGD